VRAHSLSLGGLQVSWDDPADGQAELTLVGELDNLSAPVLRQVLAGIDSGGGHDVTIDMDELRFVDSSGINELVTAWRRSRQQGGTLTVRNATEAVRRLLEMTGVADMLAPPS